jgi:non-ribosomal peptide synthetase component E (peptide arylation enzyme)
MTEATIDPIVALTPEEPGPITAALGTIVTRAARRFDAKTALIAPGRTLTYAELDDLCDRVAGDLPKTFTGKVMRRELKTLDD